MSSLGAEAPDLALLHGSLVINTGTATQDSMSNYVLALTAYNAEGCPVLLDPVGCGATALRRSNLRSLLAAGYFDVIKGNEAEIRTLLHQDDDDDDGEVKQHGVDGESSSGGGSGNGSGTPLSETAKARTVAALATRERNVVLMTGRTDFLSDGTRTFAVDNGHEYLGRMTGSGCALGTVVAAFAAVERARSRSRSRSRARARAGQEAKGQVDDEDEDEDEDEGGQEDMLQAVLAGTLLYEIAAECAGGEHGEVKGPGSFVPAFVDELYRLRVDCCEGNFWWRDKARVRVLDVDV